MLSKIWDILVRWRTWLVNLFGLVLFILPDLAGLLAAPELMAVVPAGYQKWLSLAIVLLNIWMRPRPAARAHDPEVQK